MSLVPSIAGLPRMDLGCRAWQQARVQPNKRLRWMVCHSHCYRPIHLGLLHALSSVLLLDLGLRTVRGRPTKSEVKRTECIVCALSSLCSAMRPGIGGSSSHRAELCRWAHWSALWPERTVVAMSVARG